jgi:hypothetical protein
VVLGAPDPVRLVSAGIYEALLEGLETTPRLPRDAVTVALAFRYAERLDDLFDLEAGDAAAEDAAAHARITLEITRMGARLEAMLDRLGMAPSARPAISGAGGGESGPTAEAGELAGLRADADRGHPASGIDYAASVDPAVTAADAAD